MILPVRLPLTPPSPSCNARTDQRRAQVGVRTGEGERPLALLDETACNDKIHSKRYPAGLLIDELSRALREDDGFIGTSLQRNRIGKADVSAEYTAAKDRERTVDAPT